MAGERDGSSLPPNRVTVPISSELNPILQPSEKDVLGCVNRLCVSLNMVLELREMSGSQVTESWGQAYERQLTRIASCTDFLMMLGQGALLNKIMDEYEVIRQRTKVSSQLDG